MDDFTGPRERSDLGFITFDLSADILQNTSVFKVTCDVALSRDQRKKQDIL